MNLGPLTTRSVCAYCFGAGDVGFFAILGPAGQQAVQISTAVGDPNTSSVAVTHAAGAAAGLFKAQLSVDGNGRGTLTADVKNFRTPNPVRADH